MTKCKKRSTMLPEIERVRGEQLRWTPEAQRLAGSGIQYPDHCIQLFLGEATHVTTFRQVLPQQTVGVLVDAALPGTVRIGEVNRHPVGFLQPLMRCHFPALIVHRRQTSLRLDTIEQRLCAPLMRSPSQCPGISHSSTSGGRSCNTDHVRNPSPADHSLALASSVWHGRSATSRSRPSAICHVVWRRGAVDDRPCVKINCV